MLFYFFILFAILLSVAAHNEGAHGVITNWLNFDAIIRLMIMIF